MVDRLRRRGGSPGRLWIRTAALLAATVALAWLLDADIVASIAAALAVLGGIMAARRRRPLVFRVVATTCVFAVAASAGLIALALPSFHGKVQPLLVASADERPAPPAGLGPARETLGFVDSDLVDAADGVAADARRLSTVAATAADLAAEPGELVESDADDGLVRSHLAGASALAVITNRTEDGFDGARAAAGVTTARHTLTARIADLVAEGWDGVVLDLEELPASARAAYPAFVAELSRALQGKRVLVVSPAFVDPAAPEAAGYDVGALDRAGDGIVWMAYDEHYDGSEPGPVAGLPWVRATLATATRLVPPGRLLLGLAGYGYRWRPDGSAEPVTFEQARALAETPGAGTTVDPVQGENRTILPGSGSVWFNDAASLARHAELAVTANLGGVAMWRVGAEDPAALSTLPFPPRRSAIDAASSRPIHATGARGLVALTFDDGPDPRWTPQILDVLARKGVPATFFDVGAAVEAHPDLVRAQVEGGHSVGNHTYGHPNLTALPGWRQRYELWRGSAAVEQATGYRPRLFRAPYGEGASTTSQAGGDPVAQEVRAAGMYPVPWQVDSLDYTNPGVDAIVHNVVSGVGAHSIVLMHDAGGNRAETLAALPRIIDELRASGHVFTTVDQLDAAATAPYLQPRSGASVVTGVLTVAGLRLVHGLGLVMFAALSLGVAVGLVRVLVGMPAALVHARRSRRAGPARIPDGMVVTVAIPAYNESRVIAGTLRALAACHPPPQHVVVVDDGSVDDTSAVAEACRSVLPGLRVITQPNRGKAAALNAAIAATDADIVVVIDADTQVTPSLIAEITAPFADPSVGAVAGNVKVGNRRNVLAALQALEYVISLNVDRRAQDLLGVITVVPGAAGAFRRTALDAVGGYPADTLVEDADLTQTLLRERWRIRYAPAAVVHTEAPQTLRDVVRQRRRWSFGTVQLTAKHVPTLFDPRAGRAGMIALPWLLGTQVLLPAFGPLADLWLVWSLVNGRFGVAAVAVALAIALDLTLTVIAVALDGERWTLVALSPALRLLWRPLQLVIVARAVISWLSGRNEQWNKVTRYATVDLVPQSRPGPAVPLDAAVPTPRAELVGSSQGGVPAHAEAATIGGAPPVPTCFSAGGPASGGGAHRSCR